MSDDHNLAASGIHAHMWGFALQYRHARDRPHSVCAKADMAALKPPNGGCKKKMADFAKKDSDFMKCSMAAAKLTLSDCRKFKLCSGRRFRRQERKGLSEH